MSEETIQYLGATFYVWQSADGCWYAKYPGGKDFIEVISKRSRESVIETVKEHLDNWGLPESKD